MKRFIKFYVRFVQRILIAILLTILYFTVFSVTKFFMLFISEKNNKLPVGKDSFWVTAEGYNSDMGTALEQS